MLYTPLAISRFHPHRKHKIIVCILNLFRDENLKFSDIKESALDGLRTVAESSNHMLTPAIKLGVTGLSRSGKTIFITSLIHHLQHASNLPFFELVAQGRLKRAYLEPQPNDELPRFAYEEHMAALTGLEPQWPQNTRGISQLRITLEYEPRSFLKRNLGLNKVHIDIIDYPGEWLLDLPLLSLSFEEWSAQTLARTNKGRRKQAAQTWLDALDKISAHQEQDETVAKDLAHHFTDYLHACRQDNMGFSTVPPGRFLMPGDLAGSPALTFTPLIAEKHKSNQSESLWAMMARRYESYKTHIIKPFYRTHFVHLNRQIILIDVLSALNTGPEAVSDLKQAMQDILHSFRPGKTSWLSSIWSRRIDRILFAATKADHLHQSQHQRLEDIMDHLAQEAQSRAEHAGSDIKSLALASIRTTREASAKHQGDVLPCIIGTPLKGEVFEEQQFDGKKEIAIFPGDLPQDILEDHEGILRADAGSALAPAPHARQSAGYDPAQTNVNFLRFKPPRLTQNSFPHIRLDRALQFLLGDYLS